MLFRSIAKLASDGLPAWVAGTVSTDKRPSTSSGTGSADGFEQGAKGVNGGAVRLTGAYPQ